MLVKRPPRLVLGAVLARCPRGSAGHTCATMNWALAFRELGWDVWIAEHLAADELEAPEAPGLASPQEEFWQATAREFGFEGRECLIIEGKSPQLEAFREFAGDADLFLNYSGQFKRLDLLGSRVRKAYLDVDPAFTQLWVETCGTDMNFEGHDVFLTVGANLNGPDARIPKVGRVWVPTLPAVAANAWQELCERKSNPASGAPWTTIGHWYGYHNLEWQGLSYAGKRESLLQLRTLPAKAALPCAIATDLQPEWGDYEEFLASGWKFFSASEVCHDVGSYLRFISGSKGEIGIAKAGYVVSQGGWISDRSLVYLALGRPVVLQDTGWTKVIQPEAGLLAFQNEKDCAETLQKIEGDYSLHCAAAAELTKTVFSPRKVIGDLLARIF